ncbi:MAG: phosphoribosylformylglycinamidine synthase subunit PurS [Frankiales bacterium]|jgi:phosphoribosylformylglycinamidine synthase PurS subunit|nr:phosphoribosylformylglycinamidine synthase subunit PurS [Frankiales bacterium]MDX6207761.1 phosphoribosylformylglycinamidine synthase subunit PurS [Frankiales bacterium]
MATVIVDVVLKPEILDAQGQAILAALPGLGFAGVASVRQGKHFEIEIDGDLDEAALTRVRAMADTLLANPVIEEYSVRAGT